ncbi:protein SCAI [Tanacetum coccineum]
MKIPISQSGSPNKLVWHFESKGQYTVKSGYKQALLWRKNGYLGVQPSSNQPSKFWTKLWNIPTQPKVKLFLWKAISNSVATMDNLFNRNCSSSPTCPICQSCVETIEHLLFECAWTRPIWFGSSLSLRSMPSGTNIYLRIQSLLEHAYSDKDVSCILSTVATICWSIWKAHNSFVYESAIMSPHFTLALVNAQLLEFDRINCDAAFKDSTAAIAIVGRDSSGSILHVYGTSCYAFSPLHAEIFAIHSAFPPWSIDALVANIRLWSKNINLTFSWTSRHNNKVAHYAARLTSSSTFSFSWDVSFPVELTSLERSDVYVIVYVPR